LAGFSEKVCVSALIMAHVALKNIQSGQLSKILVPQLNKNGFSFVLKITFNFIILITDNCQYWII
jgi:hypothetical protein